MSGGIRRATEYSPELKQIHSFILAGEAFSPVCFVMLLFGRANFAGLFSFQLLTFVCRTLFIWRLNLRISGCILESKKYGWLFYYSQMSDLKILFQLDWLIQRFFKRFKIDQPDSIKSFVRTYHEITKNVSHSTYLINADLYSCEEKRKILSGIYSQKSVDTMDDDMIENLFKEAMFKEIQRLEHDIQNFS